MSFLLDTNVVSELAKRDLSPNVARFIRAKPQNEFFISVITLAEIRCGVALLPNGKRRDALEAWLGADLPQRFDGRIIGVASDIALAWGDLMAWSRRNGANLEPMDGLIAATSRVRDLTLVTRNTRDFDRLGLRLLDPWIEQP
ncbi:MAG: type II toxin-antitoxin system VapC family toxin [Reyranella sp.]|uniref:type II toxin-antitoxin system VapC family toxin n=1 Tax=Reyranella sp. TaxID=1929291 RepID=UPI0025FB2172|nr:type II toxin-antitoxin system VapC family toxin [Reyranella sp.]MBR2816164.1 type II toxin-antitoxin system VapC family toxin [Reyranella sp.]